MEFLTLVMMLALVYVVISTAYYIGKRHGHRDCAPDSERADRYRGAVDALDKWCGHESPHARLIAAHLLAAGEGLAMNAGTPCGDEPSTITGMRDQLRRLPPNVGAKLEITAPAQR